MSYSPTHTRTQTFADYLHRHLEWSFKTFGTPADGRGPAGPHDHIAKELKEIEADPTDVEEWIDVIILSIDGALRSGMPYIEVNTALYSMALDEVSGLGIPYTTIEHVKSQHVWVGAALNESDRWIGLIKHAIGGYLAVGGKMEDILPKLFKKQAKNFARDWPDWRTTEPGKAIEHVRRPTEENRKLDEDGGFNGLIIGGPEAGNMRRNAAPFYRAPRYDRAVSLRHVGPSVSVDIIEYRHVQGIRFTTDKDRLDFWMTTDEIKKAESYGMNPSQHAINLIVEGYQKYMDLGDL